MNEGTKLNFIRVGCLGSQCITCLPSTCEDTSPRTEGSSPPPPLLVFPLLLALLSIDPPSRPLFSRGFPPHPHSTFLAGFCRRSAWSTCALRKVSTLAHKYWAYWPSSAPYSTSSSSSMGMERGKAIEKRTWVMKRLGDSVWKGRDAGERMLSTNDKIPDALGCRGRECAHMIVSLPSSALIFFSSYQFIVVLVLLILSATLPSFLIVPCSRSWSMVRNTVRLPYPVLGNPGLQSGRGKGGGKRRT